MGYATMGYVHAASAGRLESVRQRLAADRGQGTVEYVGLILLVLPGQGLLTILIGLLLLDFPGKRAVELKLVRRPGIAAFLNRMRARHGRPPFVVQ